MRNIYLGVNIDHVATVRNARGVSYPDPVTACALAELGGADSITTHLREDRRHITDRDVRIIRETVQTKLNLEMAINDDVMGIAVALAPQAACLVPERRQEITTEGGLEVAHDQSKVGAAVERLTKVGTVVSLFIDPVKEQIDAAKIVGAPYVEFHTGAYANAKTEQERLEKLEQNGRAQYWTQYYCPCYLCGTTNSRARNEKDHARRPSFSMHLSLKHKHHTLSLA